MPITNCGICHKPVMSDDGPVGDVVDAFRYDFDGTLDYIELFHRRCAQNKGWRIDGRGHVVGGEPRSLHEAEERFLFSYVTKNNRFNGKAYRQGLTLTSSVRLTITDQRNGHIVLEKVFQSERECSQFWKQWVRQYNAGQIYEARDASLPHPKLHFWLVSAVTEYDRKQQGKRFYNMYALPQYLAALDGIEEDIRHGESVREAVRLRFSGPLQTFVLKWLEKQGAPLDESQQVGMLQRIGEAMPELNEAPERIKYRYTVERVPRSLDYAIKDTETGKLGKPYKSEHYDEDDSKARAAAQGAAARMNRDWIEQKERDTGKRYQMHESNTKHFGSVRLDMAPIKD